MTGKLTFGYLYDFRNPPNWRQPWSEYYAQLLDTIEWTEALGFGGAWVPEHHLADDGYIPSPLIVLAAIAARTKSMRLGTSVALAPLYNPVRFAEDCAVLNILSGGRLEMGVAIGFRRREFEALGVDVTKRGRMFDEWLDIVTRLWAGETVDSEGPFFPVQGAKVMPPVEPGRIPLYIGGFGEKMIERGMRYGDGYIGSPEMFQNFDAMLEAQGGAPGSAKARISGMMTAVAHDPVKALDELAPYYLHVANSYAEWALEDKPQGANGKKPMSLEEFKASGQLKVLTPEQAIAMFREMQERMPLDHYMMTYPPGFPRERFREYAELFAKEVIPAFS